MESLYIASPDLSQEENCSVLAASVRVGKTEMRLWFRTPKSVNPSLSSDSFFAACLIPAMASGKTLKTESPISASLLCAADTVQNIFHNWFPKLVRIQVSADPVSRSRVHRGGVGCFFSGGVDSLYTFLKREQEITTIVYVHGFDVGLNDDVLRRKVSEALQEFAARTGKSLIEVETNLRDFTNQHGAWGEEIHGSALASVGLLLDSLLERIYIPSSYAYSELFPWASHPLVDPLWSTETIQIIHDGCQASRFEKIALIAKDDRALATLRVCWENPDGEYNCGQCEKCLRTMTALEILGALDRCPTFLAQLNLETIREFELKGHGPELFWKDNYNAAVKHKQDNIAAALKIALDKYSAAKVINSLSDQFPKIVASPRWNEFVLSHRERLFLSLLNENRWWMTLEIFKENIKRLRGKNH